MPRRIRFSKKQDDFILQLAGDEDSSDLENKHKPFRLKADVLAFAAAYGASENAFKEIADPSSSAIRYSVFSGHGYDTLFKLLSAYKTEGIDILSSDKEDGQVDIFEGYSNGGLELLEAELRGHTDKLTRLLLLTRRRSSVDSELQDFLEDTPPPPAEEPETAPESEPEKEEAEDGE